MHTIGTAFLCQRNIAVDQHAGTKLVAQRHGIARKGFAFTRCKGGLANLHQTQAAFERAAQLAELLRYANRCRPGNAVHGRQCQRREDRRIGGQHRCDVDGIGGLP